MQVREAMALQKAWGDKPCSHPRFEKEYNLGSQTGDYVCTTCGESFSPEGKKAIEAKRDVQL
ncbi:MAG: hypothetical protein FWD89_04795 [Firmicutes bacterium]|nr:hypothetical protein [Bacillota bacterium]MCL2771599.1 hypothetical protein [Bacillota bacterium]